MENAAGGFILLPIFFLIWMTGIYALILFIIFCHKGIKAFNVYIEKNKNNND